MSFKVIGFGPTDDPRKDWIGIARWSFCIELEFQLAKKLFSKPLPESAGKSLHEIACRQHMNIFQDWDHEGGLFPRRQIFNFWSDRCLLTNVSVEPGNACGLDMEPGDFAAVERDSKSFWDGKTVRYLPHNVDSQRQATALLAAWLTWYNHIDSLLTM